MDIIIWRGYEPQHADSRFYHLQIAVFFGGLAQRAAPSPTAGNEYYSTVTIYEENLYVSTGTNVFFCCSRGTYTLLSGLDDIT